MAWTKEKITEAIKALHRENVDLSYNRLAKKNQPLVSAAAYHFGSYRKAIEKAGIAYAKVVRRPRWTKQLVIAAIKLAKRDGIELHWSAVTRRKDELGKAAYAALQQRLFGSWDRALHAAGLDADDVARYRTWDRDTIVSELKSRVSSLDAVNSGAVQTDDPGLHAACLRHFGTFDGALKAAKIKPENVRKRRKNKGTVKASR